MTIKDNLNIIKKNIEDAKKRVGRTDHVEILAATKFQEYDKIDQSIDWGIKTIGENRTDAMIDRIEHYGKDDLNYHFIGYLQRNKIRDIIGRVDLIHSVGTKRLAEAINNRGKFEDLTQDVLIQVNVSKEETKNGIYVEEIDEFVYNILKCKNIRVRGFMTMAPYGAEESELRHIFGTLKHYYDNIKKKEYPGQSIDYLSMGMSGDYGIAVEEGANIVRIGSKIYGERNY